MSTNPTGRKRLDAIRRGDVIEYFAMWHRVRKIRKGERDGKLCVFLELVDVDTSDIRSVEGAAHEMWTVRR